MHTIFKLCKMNCQIKVSSVLNKDSKQFGKQHLLDSSVETCWNSETGSPQTITIKMANDELFGRGRKNGEIAGIQLQFQGEFRCRCFCFCL